MRRESIGFAIGSLFFALGSTPGYLGLVGTELTNVTFFVGSLFFTAAGFLQLRLSGRCRSGAWRDRTAWQDWWSAAVQSVGTLYFNISTGSALIQSLTVEEKIHHVWRPDALGSVCFLIASALAVAATRGREGLWDPEARNWWNTWLNMLGSVAFAISAVAAYINPATGQALNTDWANLGTFLGALCFGVAALLVKPPRGAADSVPTLNEGLRK